MNMPNSSIRKYILSEKLQQAYLARVHARIGQRASFIKLDRYRTSFEKIAEIVDALDVVPLSWIDIQFHFLDKSTCLKIFSRAYPPPGALHSAGALDRFMDWISEYESLEDIEMDNIKESAYLSSCAMIEMLSFSQGASDINDPNFMDLIAVHLNSGDISTIWVKRQQEEWMENFLETYKDLLRPDVVEKIKD